MDPHLNYERNEQEFVDAAIELAKMMDGKPIRAMILGATDHWPEFEGNTERSLKSANVPNLDFSMTGAVDDDEFENTIRRVSHLVVGHGTLYVTAIRRV